MEDVIRVKEAQLEIIPTPINRAELHRAKSKLKRFMKIEE